MLHYGPAPDVDDYFQESGRIGRNGKQSFAILLRFRMLCLKVYDCLSCLSLYFNKVKHKKVNQQLHFDLPSYSVTVLNVFDCTNLMAGQKLSSMGSKLQTNFFQSVTYM